MGFVIDFDSSTILLFSLIWAGIFTFLRLKRKKSLVYLIFFTIFYVYIVKVLELTQFPIFFTEDMRQIYGQTVWKSMNFIPLFDLEYKDTQTSLLNIILAIPFGFGLPFISKISTYKMILYGVVFATILEIIQLTTALIAKFTFRIVDINDIIFNLLGVIIGYIFFLVFINLYRKIFKKEKKPENPILSYILER